MAHRESIRAYLESLELKNVFVVDWGCGAKPVKRYVKHQDCEFFGIDKNPECNPDLVADFDTRLILDRKYNMAFCMEVLEHATRPRAVLRNIYKNLRKDGTLHLSVPFLYPKHSEEDYWRYTDQGITLLLEREGFTVEHIQPTENNMGWIVKAVK